MIFGKDHQPSKPIIMGETEISVRTSCNHMGVRLCNNETKIYDMVCERIGAGRAVLHAARGLGSQQVPVTPAVLSKLYWSIAVPKMVYGFEVTPISKSRIRQLDDAHRQNAKIVQGLPANISKQPPLTLLGWLTLESYIDMNKILFLWNMLCLPHENIYRRITTFIISLLLSEHVHKKRDSPISSMLKVVTAYKRDEILREHLLRGDFGDFYRWKRLIKKIVWDNEITKWKLSCMLYSELDVYRNCVCHMGMHSWWQLARHKPNLTNLVSGVLAVLQGGQPRGMQCNFDSKACKLCDTAQRDNAQHVLFVCPGLDTVRFRAWDSVIRSMPDLLVVELRNSNIKTKWEIILSG